MDNEIIEITECNTDDWIEKVEALGNDLLDKYVFPTMKGALCTGEEISTFLTFKTAFLKEKINLFIKYIDYKNEQEIKEFIENVHHEKKYFLIQAINKTMEMDDDLQIFILAYLTKQNNKNGELNYYERSLFYNINQLSKDDFLIFHQLIIALVPTNNPENKDDIFYNMSKCNDIEETVLRKFLGIGILKHDVARFNSGKSFLKTEYTDTLNQVIINYKDIKN